MAKLLCFMGLHKPVKKHWHSKSDDDLYSKCHDGYMCQRCGAILKVTNLL